ncbi:hypothetical protein P4K96_29740, partial [Bacillus cereus]|nr:hypothetical protein [Bacillus cereus]
FNVQAGNFEGILCSYKGLEKDSKLPSGNTIRGVSSMRPNKRIGLIVPAGNTTLEPDFYYFLSPYATIHATRIAGPVGVESEEGIDAFNEQVERAIQELSRAQVDVIVYGFTTGSFYREMNYCQALIRNIQSIAGIPVVTPSTAIIKALHDINAKRIFITTPYTKWNNEVLLKFLLGTEFDVIGLQGDDRLPKQAILKPMWNQEPEEIITSILALSIPTVDALICPCTAWRTLEVLGQLEEQMQTNIITANQAAIWETINLLGYEVSIKNIKKLHNPS